MQVLTASKGAREDQNADPADKQADAKVHDRRQNRVLSVSGPGLATPAEVKQQVDEEFAGKRYEKFEEEFHDKGEHSVILRVYYSAVWKPTCDAKTFVFNVGSLLDAGRRQHGVGL